MTENKREIIEQILTDIDLYDTQIYRSSKEYLFYNKSKIFTFLKGVLFFGPLLTPITKHYTQIRK